MLRLTKTVCFAEEMTRLCLSKPEYYRAMGLHKSWESWEAKVLKDDDRVVTLRVRVRGFSRVIYSTCYVMQDQSVGQCRIELRGNDPHEDAYWCVFRDEELRYFGRSHSITEPAFGLDEDLARDLRHFGVKTWLDLQMLSEEQVVQIFRRSILNSDPYVMTHPDPAQYVAGEISDKRQRLQLALDKMGAKLEGSPLSKDELADLL